MKYVGVTDEITVCECCNKSNLKKAVVLQQEGEYKFFGMTCAARALGYNSTPSGTKTILERLHIEERTTVTKEILQFKINLDEYRVMKRWEFQLKMNPNVDKEKAERIIKRCGQIVIDKITEKFSYQIKSLHIFLNNLV